MRLCLLVLVAALLPAAAVARVPAPGEPANPAASCLNAQRQGADASGKTDATTALQRSLNAARGRSPACVYLPPGRYATGRLTIPGGVKLVGAGTESVLYATNPNRRGLTLSGSGGGIYRLKLLTRGTKRTNDNEAITIAPSARRFVIDSVTIDGGNGAGIITFGGAYGRITRNQVRNTKADGIHLSGGAHHLYVAGNRVRHTGDDMIAVVTYADQRGLSGQILIENNDVANQPWGRGISVVGGENITIRDNTISRPAAAGIYIASEKSWDTKGVNNVLVIGNTIAEASRAHPEAGHPAILVYSDSGRPVRGVRLEGNRIITPKVSALRIDRPGTANIQCAGNTLDGKPIRVAACTTGARISGTSVTADLLLGPPGL